MDAMTNSPLNNVPYEQIVQTLRPLLDQINQFIGAAQDVMNARAGTPGAESGMVDDIARKQPFLDTEKMAEPIEHIAMNGSLSCFAAQESLASLVRLIETGPPPPIFSADVLCRSAIDSSRPAWWLTEAGLSTERRVQRVVAESLYSATEMAKVTSEPGIKQRGIKIRDRLLAYAVEHDWEVGKDTNVVTVAAEVRPTVRKFLEAEFGDPAAAHVTWSHLSAVTHGTQYGLIQAMDIDSVDGNTAIMGTSTDTLSARLEIASSVVMSSTNRCLQYMGWATEATDAATVGLMSELRSRALGRM
jgi:hypothetical protein